MCHRLWLSSQRDVEELEEEKQLLEERVKELTVHLEKKEQELDQQVSPMGMTPLDLLLWFLIEKVEFEFEAAAFRRQAWGGAGW